MPPRTISKDKARKVADRYFTMAPDSGDGEDDDGFDLPPTAKPRGPRSAAEDLADKYVPEPRPELEPLSEKEWRFVEEYCVDWNGAQAAIRCGYSNKSARVTAHRLLTKANIALQVEKRRRDLEAKASVNSLTILDRLHAELLADMADLFDEATGALKPVHEWPLIWRRGMVSGVKVKVLKDEDGNETGYTAEVKLADRVRRIELLGRHHLVAAFREAMKGDNAQEGDEVLRDLREQLNGTALKPNAMIEGTAREVSGGK